MSPYLWTYQGDVHLQPKDGQDKTKAKVGGTWPNLRTTPIWANHPVFRSVTTATNLGTLPGNAECPNKLGPDRHRYRTIWTRMKTSCTCNKKSTPLTYSIMPSTHSTHSRWNRKTP